MKKLFILSVSWMMFASCHSQQSKAVEDQKKAMEVLKNQRDADAITTTDGGWTMTAKINGKPWKANYMYPIASTARIIGHLNDEFISFPFSKQKMVAGKKIMIKEGYAADLFLKDGIGTWGGDKGEINITSVNGKWVEATFFFTASATGTSKITAVTDGFFRIAIE